MDVWREADDHDLVTAVAGGHVDALAVLHERHQPWLAVRLLRRCNDPELVAEVVQDTFVAVWRSAGRYRGEGAVAAWLWGIAVRQLIARLRRGHASAHLPMSSNDVSRGSAVSAEEAVLEGVEYGDLGRALGRLSPELRSVLQATVLDGLNAREAGRLLGVSEVTVRTRLHRARKRMRALLMEERMT